MKKYIFISVLIFSTISFSQIYNSHRFEVALSRIQQAFNTASQGDFWTLFTTINTIRIEDSLYQNISCIQTESILKEFFQNKDSIEFTLVGNFMSFRRAEGNGTITYVVDKKRESLNVDVYLNDFNGEILISAINISNYPYSTAFNNFTKTKRDTIK